jgi:hypothetical protein
VTFGAFVAALCATSFSEPAKHEITAAVMAMDTIVRTEREIIEVFSPLFSCIPKDELTLRV